MTPATIGPFQLYILSTFFGFEGNKSIIKLAKR